MDGRQAEGTMQRLVVGAFTVLLLWYFGEIEFCLWHTSKFWPLVFLFPIVFLPVASQICVRARCVGRVLWALLLLNVTTGALAALTARALNPAYDFKTPLLRISALLLSQLWS